MELQSPRAVLRAVRRFAVALPILCACQCLLVHLALHDAVAFGYCNLRLTSISRRREINAT